MSRETVRNAIHDIKQWNGLRPDDDIRILSDGDVEDENGDVVGNILDEAGIGHG